MKKDGQLPYYRAVHETFKTTQSASSPKKALGAVVRNVIKAVDVDGCSVLLLDSARQCLITGATQGLSDWYLRKGLLDAQKSLGETLQGKVVEITDATSDSRLQYPEFAQQAGIASLLSVPIMKKKDEVIGELRLYSRQSRRFTREETSFLTSMADLTALILENARLTDLAHKAAAEAEAKSTALISELKRPLTFAHPSEEEFTRLLDFYRIEWLYEPRSFVLQQENGRTTEMFTPDFYLPELGLYIEITTSKQSLMTEKNRKVRRLKILYPDVNIMLLNKKDYSRLLAKYGYGPLAKGGMEGIERPIFGHSQIQRRVKQLASNISRDYKGKNLLLVGILKGVVFFMADLMRYISIPAGIDFMAISYYTSAASQAVRITKDLDSSISGMDVLMVEDIVDTGMTLNYVLKHLEAHKPSSLQVCTLLDKRSRRLVDIHIAYVGFEIGDDFVVGYGLDHKGGYRNLPFIGVLKPELLAETA